MSILVEGIKTLDDIVDDVPAAFEQYLYYASNAFNIALMLYNSSQVNDATCLACLSCDASYKWYHAKSDDSSAITKVVLSMFLCNHMSHMLNIFFIQCTGYPSSFKYTVILNSLTAQLLTLKNCPIAYKYLYVQDF